MHAICALDELHTLSTSLYTKNTLFTTSIITMYAFDESNVYTVYNAYVVCSVHIVYNVYNVDKVGGVYEIYALYAIDTSHTLHTVHTMYAMYGMPTLLASIQHTHSLECIRATRSTA